MRLIDGKTISDSIDNATRQLLEGMAAPTLAIVNAGNDPASQTYIKLKSRRAEGLGIKVQQVNISPDISMEGVVQSISELNDDPTIDGIIIQLPLYQHLRPHTWEIVNKLDPRQDVDGLTAAQQGALSQNLTAAIAPATVQAVLECLKYVHAEGNYQFRDDGLLGLIPFLRGKQVVIVNHSNLIGKPLATALLNLQATVTVAHEHTVNLAELTSTADIVITATGETGLILPEMLKQGSIVIDCTSVKTDAGVVGDVVGTNELADRIAWLTPVPGGIGPVTISCLLYSIAKLKHEK